MKTTFNITIILLSLILFSGCAVSNLGGTYTNKQFVYPNSNVTPLGQTSAKKFKVQVLMLNPVSFKKKDYEKVEREALSKYPEADILINGSADWTQYWVLMNYIIVYKYTLTGTAAKMEVGKQDIGQ